MTRTEAIAIINAKLASLDDERILSVVEIIDDMAADSDMPRQLSERELDLLDQSKADFAAGRTMTFDDVVASINEHLAPHGVAPYRKP